VKSYSYLFWAYATVWVGIAGYALYLSSRLRKVEKALDELAPKR
jgi:CcmD family protein